jgi:tetratricopeptide (TPR) repeat protein
MGARQANETGTAFARQGRLAEAAAQYQRALALDPGLAEAHNNLGNVRRAQGDLAGAIACFRRALVLRPGFAMAHDNLGVALHDAGRLAEAAASHRRALALQPDRAAAHANLGRALLAQGEAAAAAASYRRALALQPGDAAAHLDLGNALRRQGELEEAAACYAQAAALRPTDAQAPHNLGRLLLEQERLTEAEANLRRALALRPDYAEAHLNLGNALQGQGRFAEALVAYRRAIAIRPQDPAAHVNAAFMLLLTGDLAAGWREYEWRWHGVQPPGLDMPRWHGETLPGTTILLHCEQGFGDSLHFIRYAAMVRARCAKVVLACPAPLARLFAGVAGVDLICPEGQTLPACDRHVPLLSLPLLFATELATIPGAVPYLAPPACSTWTARLDGQPGLKVGLVWAGNPRSDQPDAQRVDRRRSLRLAQFDALAGIAGVQWYSLQKGAAAAQPGRLTLTDWMDEAGDFADTAGLVAALDLVIGVDTAVVHLAGALGRPVWVLSRFDGCWRWLLDRADSPWYPTLQLFRQPAPGDWDSVIAAVAVALRALVAQTAGRT